MDPTTAKTHTDNVREASRSATALVNVSLPATVVSYDETEQRATVRLVPCFRRRNPRTGEVDCYRPPDIPGVPVYFPGGGDVSFTWPIEPGHSGLVVFCDRSTDEWKREGGDRSEPQDPRRHSLSDAIFLPGLRPFSDPIPAAGYASGATVLRSDDLRLGSSGASAPVALAPTTDSRLDALEAWAASMRTTFDLHTHAGTVPIPATGAPAAPSGASTAAGKVKAE